MLSVSEYEKDQKSPFQTKYVKTLEKIMKKMNVSDGDGFDQMKLAEMFYFMKNLV